MALAAFRYTPPFYNFSSSALRAWWVEHLLGLARLNATVDPSGTTPLYVKRVKSAADDLPSGWVGFLDVLHCGSLAARTEGPHGAGRACSGAEASGGASERCQRDRHPTKLNGCCGAAREPDVSSTYAELNGWWCT